MNRTSKIVLGVLIGIPAGIVALFFGFMVFLYVLHWRMGSRQLETDERSGAQIIRALESYQHDHARYPAALKEIQPAYMARLPKQGYESTHDFYYAASTDGSEFWLACDDQRVGAVLPSDSVAQYDSKNPGWISIDVSEMKATQGSDLDEQNTEAPPAQNAPIAQPATKKKSVPHHSR